MNRLAQRALLATAGVFLVAGPSAAPISWGPAGGPLAARLVAAGPAEFTLTSPSVAVANLRYAGMVSLEGLVTLQSLEFTLDSAHMSGMTMVWPCPVRSTIAAPHTTTFSGSVVLDVTSLSFVWGLVPFAFTPLDPPPPGFTIDSATLTDFTMVAGLATADTLTAEGMTSTVEDC